jgi:hypothetical protein
MDREPRQANPRSANVQPSRVVLKTSACRLTRITDAGKDRWSKKRGLYRCSCGTEKEIDDHSVRTGKTKSCGCLNRESLQDRAKMRERQVAGGLAIKGRPGSCKGLIRIYEFESKYSKPRGRNLWVTLEELAKIYHRVLPDPFAEPERFAQVRPYKKQRYNGNRFVKLRK